MTNKRGEAMVDYVNGCDSWIDGFWIWNWRHCCDVHDIQYTAGGEWWVRLAYDAQLGLCVSAAALPIAFIGAIMAFGTVIAGWLFYRFTGLKGRNIAEIVLALLTRSTPAMATAPARELRPKDMDALEVMEGKVPYVYDDAIYPTKRYRRGAAIQGTLTAGVGHTGVDLLPWIGKEIPEDQIDKWLDDDTDVAEHFVNTRVTVPLNNNQFAALTFWTFNVGVGAVGKSTLLKKLNAGDYDSVPVELRKWTKTTISGKKVTSNGLIKRRSDEIAYWLADQSNIPKVVPRPKDKPTGTQVAEKDNGSLLTPENIGIGASGLSALGAISMPQIAWAIAIVIVGAAAVAGFFIIRKHLSK